MPELPDITVYVERMADLLQGATSEGVRLVSPFLLRTVTPSLAELNGARFTAMHRMGKRLVLEFQDDTPQPLFMVLHLMVAGRLRLRPDAKRASRNAVALLDFKLRDGRATTLLFTEASKKKRASLHLIRGREGLAEHDRGGIDVRTCPHSTFREVLRANRHTLKRGLTDPRYFDGIGNAYSDEILWFAGLSPVRMTTALSDEEVERLHAACVDRLEHFTAALRREVGDGFPDKVTAFRKDMAVHGKYGKPCPACSTPVQRIVYAENETNYCPGCQTNGKLLADRALSRLLKKDWPKTVAELENIRRSGPASS